MIEVVTPACLGCDDTVVFVMTEEEHARYRAGEHVQRIFPHWSAKDRERLISGTCPTCWEEMWAEEEEDEEDDWYPEDEDWELTPSLLDPESDDFTYERDWYVD
jgi:hypothetical protein